MIVCRVDIMTVDEISGGTVMTVWTVNGSFVVAEEFPFMIRDCDVTGFDGGTRKNVAVALTTDSEPKVIEMISLRVTQTMVCDKSACDGTLSIWKNRLVCIDDVTYLHVFQINFE
jgi:hypothetical protein